MQAVEKAQDETKNNDELAATTAAIERQPEQEQQQQQEQFEYTVEEFRKSPKSVYMVNFRTIYEDDYPAKFDPELACMLIQLYSYPGELVIDPLNGSGTIALTAASLGRRGWGQDINKEAIAISEEKRKKAGYSRKQCYFSLGDSREVLALDKSDKGKAGFALMSPPFGNTGHSRYKEGVRKP
jgi:DNA modification methylase